MATVGTPISTRGSGVGGGGGGTPTPPQDSGVGGPHLHPKPWGGGGCTPTSIPGSWGGGGHSPPHPRISGWGWRRPHPHASCRWQLSATKSWSGITSIVIPLYIERSARRRAASPPCPALLVKKLRASPPVDPAVQTAPVEPRPPVAVPADIRGPVIDDRSGII